MKKQTLYTIAPHAPFLCTLVEGILNGPLLGDWPKTGPFWLADVTIILPTIRAQRALESTFADALGGAALLPDIRTLGMEGEEEGLYLDISEQDKFPTVIPELERRFLLCQLVQKWIEQNEGTEQNGLQFARANPARILSLADSLATLIDEMESEGISASAIRALPALDIAQKNYQDLAINFEHNLQFLEIILSEWPKILAERKDVDRGVLKNLRAEQQAKNLDRLFGDRPVIGAGSTGSVRATAKLFKAITRLERGCLVLPGLDTSLNETGHRDLLEIENAPHGHPQYGLAQLLRGLGKTPVMVHELAPLAPDKRTELVRHALALAKDTATWNKVRVTFSDEEISKATQNIAIAKASTEQEQALGVALRAREALENNQSVGIITPDRNFARRVAVELKRFGINVDDSAGTPLFHSRAGRLMRQILALGLDNFAPVDLMALLRNPYVTLGRTRADISKVSNWIEFALLRGQRPSIGINGLRDALKQNVARKLSHVALQLDAVQGKIIGQLFDDLEQAFKPLIDLLKSENFSPAKLAEILNAVFDSITPPPDKIKNSMPGFVETKKWAQDLTQSRIPGPALGAHNAEVVLQALMQKITVRTRNDGHDNIAIWGRLEARLQSPDLIILCTLNEGTWPEIADPGPWLSRGMRLNAGLEPPERQQGLAAHDFEMAIGHSNVLITYAQRVGAAPALPSRLLERFCTFVGETTSAEMHKRGARWINLARALDKTGIATPAIRPAPAPPAILRPRSISITEVETLIRSPFDLYAKYVLKLRALDPLGADALYRERGNLIHEVFARFVEDNHDPMSENAHKDLMEIAYEVFSVLDGQPGRRDIWLRRFEKSALEFVEFERERNPIIARRFAEKELAWTFPVEGQEFKLRGRADRIDLRHDGQLEILDFKTGNIPAKNEMRDFLAPQLLVEAAIAKATGFKGVAPSSTHMANYIKIGAGPVAFSLNPFECPDDLSINDAANRLMERLYRHISAFLLSNTSIMSPRIMPKANQSYMGDYDHLARTDEWSQIDASGENQ